MSEQTTQGRRTRPPRRQAVLLLLVVVAAGCTRGRLPPHVSPLPRPTELPVPEPNIVSRPIPFPDSRKHEMLAYARRHYGLNAFGLAHPQAIVEHFTGTTTFEPVFNTFAANQPDLGELPGTCAHFVVDTDGTIYQLVSLDLMCRHTVGLNYTAIGIEMVGERDQDILDNAPQLSAALDLTLWLIQRFDIELRNVIGHNESLTSPLHKELVPSFRCQTHQDWNHEDMQVFRRDLARRAARFLAPMGPPATPVDSGC
jgi:N-acetylmuramoyl-L-alanine amidase-like protein